MLAGADDSVQPWPTILIIGESPDDRTVAQAALAEEGYTVLSTTGGHAGLAAFEAEHPDCVLIDLNTSDLDALAVCQSIRARPEGHHTSIIALAPLRDGDAVDDAWLAGCDDILAKPLRANELLAHVRTVLKLRYMDAKFREQCELSRRQRDLVTRLQHQNERLTVLLHGELTKPNLSCEVQSRVTHVTTVDLPRLVSALFKTLAPSARSSAVTLVPDLAIKELWADPDLLWRVLENLLDNALRYAPSGSRVSVSARSVCGSAIELRVTDAGPGFEPALRDSVFERYWPLELYERAQPRGRRGLGLAFCKLAIDAHGGSIRVEDAAPGAAICMFIPTRERRNSEAPLGV